MLLRAYRSVKFQSAEHLQPFPKQDIEFSETPQFSSVSELLTWLISLNGGVWRLSALGGFELERYLGLTTSDEFHYIHDRFAEVSISVNKGLDSLNFPEGAIIDVECPGKIFLSILEEDDTEIRIIGSATMMEVSGKFDSLIGTGALQLIPEASIDFAKVNSCMFLSVGIRLYYVIYAIAITISHPNSL
jgi:hypothetical protein